MLHEAVSLDIRAPKFVANVTNLKIWSMLYYFMYDRSIRCWVFLSDVLDYHLRVRCRLDVCHVQIISKSQRFRVAGSDMPPKKPMLWPNALLARGFVWDGVISPNPYGLLIRRILKTQEQKKHRIGMPCLSQSYRSLGCLMHHRKNKRFFQKGLNGC